MTPADLLDEYALFLVPLASEHLADIAAGVPSDEYLEFERRGQR